jgi:osmotically-inducible protein OsmY
MRADLQIEEDVKEELAHDPDAGHGDVSVHVGSGIARLSGRTSTYAARVAARRAAERVSGVRAVLDDLCVEPPPELRRSDADIARTVEVALGLNVQIPTGIIRCSVTDGWVTLEGHAARQADRCAAEASVATLAGVRGIRNRIRLEPDAAPSPSLVLDIEKALRRSAELDCKHVVIDVESDGTVLMRGMVRSWAEHRDAERAAWSTTGVRRVVNRLMVVP